MFGVKNNQESKKIIPEFIKDFKTLARLVLGTRTLLLRISSKDASNGSMEKHKQICNTHLALCGCVSSIELSGILDLDNESDMRVTDENGRFLIVVMSLHSIHMEIVVLSLGKISSL